MADTNLHSGSGKADPSVIGVLLAGVLASFVIPGPFDWGSTLIGVVLLLVLIAYGEYPQDLRSAIGAAAAAAFTLLLVLGRLLDRTLHLTDWADGTTLDSYAPSRDGGWELAALWSALFVGLVVAWRLVDRREDRM